MGGILGIDPGSFDKTYVKDGPDGKKNGAGSVVIGTGAGGGDTEDVFGIEERGVDGDDAPVGADGEVLRRRDGEVIMKVKEGKKKKGSAGKGVGSGNSGNSATEGSDDGAGDEEVNGKDIAPVAVVPVVKVEADKKDDEL